MSKTIFTIGHSNHPLDWFLSLLSRHEITFVCDVRSFPYSKTNPQFSSDPLIKELKANKLSYEFLGKELGARSDDPKMYENGKVRYERLAETDSFQNGLRIVRDIAASQRVALLCAEKDPLYCHRMVLVGRYLDEAGIEVLHILADGSLEKQKDSLIRLSRLLNLAENDFFKSQEEILADVYAMQAERIAYDLNKNHSDILLKENGLK